MCTLIHFARGQELDFSMYQYTPLLTNPGMLAEQKNINVALNYRNQSVDIGENFQTSMLSFYYPQKVGSHRLIFAGSFMNDRASDFLVTNGGVMAITYSLKLSKRSELSLGAQWGYFQRKTDGDFTTDEQFVNGRFDPGVPSSDIGMDRSKGYLTLSQGLYWRLLDQQQMTKVYLGVSAFNSNRPDASFYEEESRLPVSLKAIAGYRVYQGMKLAVTPTVRWVSQASQNFFNLGSRFSYALSSKKDDMNQIAMGLWYNTNDLGIVSMEFSRRDFTLAASYDLPLSSAIGEAQNGIAELMASIRIK